jgi:hypothetical protein
MEIIEWVLPAPPPKGVLLLVEEMIQPVRGIERMLVGNVENICCDRILALGSLERVC